MDPADLDRLLDRELQALPLPRAPRTLLPRVLTAVQAGVAPGAAPTGWLTWSGGRRAASLAAIVLLAVVAGALASDLPAPVSRAAETALAASTVVRVFWDVLLQPLAGYFLGLGVLFVLACAAAWAGMEAALGGASQR